MLFAMVSFSFVTAICNFAINLPPVCDQPIFMMSTKGFADVNRAINDDLIYFLLIILN